MLYAVRRSLWMGMAYIENVVCQLEEMDFFFDGVA